jgi:hypothetical protein
MRLRAMRAALVGLAGAVAAAAGGCVPVYSGTVEIVRVDPEDAAERAAIGALLGAALGTGFGASVALNPALGAVIGIEAGAGIGAAIGAITAQPLPSYAPVVVPAEALIPGFYDAWPPGNHPPPIPAATPPPPPAPSPA